MDEIILKQLIDEAEQGLPTLSEAVLNVPGFSTPKVRRLLNALCSQPGANYLEIGVHIGSTFIPAVYGNTAQATCIDSWNIFQGSYEKFLEIFHTHLDGRQVNAIKQDCFTVDLDRIPQGINVYFYDGAHTREAHYKALTYFEPVLADRFVLIVDDWNWQEPRDETERAVKDLKWREIVRYILPGPYDGGDPEQWWNGLYVALIEKVNQVENLPTA